jgi:hypothetical protein
MLMQLWHNFCTLCKIDCYFKIFRFPESIMQMTEEMVTLLGEVIEMQHQILKVLRVINGCSCIEPTVDSSLLEKAVATDNAPSAEGKNVGAKEIVEPVTPSVKDAAVTHHATDDPPKVEVGVSIGPDVATENPSATTSSLKPIRGLVGALLSARFKVQNKLLANAAANVL